MGLQTRGAVVTSWDRLDPYHMFGAPIPSASAGGAGAADGMARAAGPALTERGAAKPWHPDSPLFWFGGLLAVTLGLIGASASVRFGPFRAGAAAGKS